MSARDAARRAEGEERFRRLFVGAADRTDLPDCDPSRPVLAAAAVVYSNVYLASLARHGGAPAARDEARLAASDFYDGVLQFAGLEPTA